MAIAVLYEKEELKAIFKECLAEDRAAQEKKSAEFTTYTINQVANMLDRSHSTIKKLVKSGRIPVTNDNRITQLALNDYLSGLHTNNK